MPTREETAAGALLGTFAGDALGARWEGSPPAPDRDAGERLQRSEDEAELVYTDDTQLALALAEHLCDEPHVDPQQLAATFLDHYQPWRGYGGGMHGIIQEWRKGTLVEDAATAVFPSGSFGNGAAMRVAAVGVLWADHPDTLEAVARRQAAVTHVHTLGIDGAVVQARAVGLAASRGRFGRAELTELAGVPASDELRTGLRAAAELVDSWSGDSDLDFADVAQRLGNTVTAQRSVPAALWVAATAEGLRDGIELALGLGGDADTIAAMVGAVLGAAGGLQAIPPAWLRRLEDGERGRSYALMLAGRLAAAARSV